MGKQMKNGVSHAWLTAVLLLGATTLATPVFGANVGYYDVTSGEGSPNQVAPITAVGHNPVQVFDLSPAELSSIDVLMVQNSNNSGYAAEFLGAIADIEAAVSAGLSLVVHDRYVTEAETVLPGGGSFDIIRDFSDDANIQILDNSTLVTNGPAGVIDDTTLDGGNSSSHGYAVAGTLPADAVFILSRSASDEIVDFCYQYGSGFVYFSSVPLDFYLGGAGNNPPADAFREIYAPNVVANAVAKVSTFVPIPVMNGIGLLLLAFGLAMVAYRRMGTA